MTGTRRFSISLTSDASLPIPSSPASNTTTSILTQPVKPTTTSQHTNTNTTKTNTSNTTAVNTNNNNNTNSTIPKAPTHRSEGRRMSVIKTDKPKPHTTSNNTATNNNTVTTTNKDNNSMVQSGNSSLASTLSTTIHSDSDLHENSGSGHHISGSGPAVLHSQLTIEIIKNMSNDSYWNNRLKLFEMINNKLNNNNTTTNNYNNNSTTTDDNTNTTNSDNNNSNNNSGTNNSINTSTNQRSGIAFFSLTIFDLIIDTALTHISDLHHKVAIEAIYTIHLCIIYYNIYHSYIDNKLGYILVTLFNRLSDRRQVVKDHTNNILILIRDTIPPVIIMTALSPKINEVNERMKTPMIVYINTLIPLCTEYFIQYTYTYTFLTRICYIIQPTSNNNTKPTNTLLIQINKTLILLYQTSPISVRSGIANLSLTNQLIVKRMLSTHVPDIDSLVAQAGRGQEQGNNSNNSVNNSNSNKLSSTNNLNNRTISITTASNTSNHNSNNNNNNNNNAPVAVAVIQSAVSPNNTAVNNGWSPAPLTTTSTTNSNGVHTSPIQANNNSISSKTVSLVHTSPTSRTPTLLSPVRTLDTNTTPTTMPSPVNIHDSSSNSTPTILVLEQQDKRDSDEGYDVCSPADLNLTASAGREASESLNRQISARDSNNTSTLTASPHLTPSPGLSVSVAATAVTPTALSYTPYSTSTQQQEAQTQTVTSPLQQQRQKVNHTTPRSPTSQQAVTTPMTPQQPNNSSNSPAASITSITNATSHNSATTSLRRKSLTPRSVSTKKIISSPYNADPSSTATTTAQVTSTLQTPLAHTPPPPSPLSVTSKNNSSVGSVSWVLSSLQAPAPRGQMMEAVHQLKGWIKTENNGFWTCNSAQVRPISHNHYYFCVYPVNL